nr:snurportin-1-like isoform X2 [Rhipicephalus microplus]
MDGLLDSLSTGLRVSLDENSTATPHPRFALYKLKHSASSQEARRQKFFEEQKKKRSDLFEHARRLALGSDDRGASGDNEEKMDCTVSRTRSNAPRLYRNRLMLSEWLVEVPEDFVENWLMVPCPVAKRCLVVSSKGSTKSYARNGYRIAMFSSLLPGGSKSSDGKHSDFCLLDCVFSELHRTYYILDLLCWKSHPVCDSEMDGLLFYHKKGHYFEGVSPLVGWLKPYMVPEILGTSVDPHYLEKQPPKHQTDLKEKLEANKSRTRSKVEAIQLSAEDCDTELSHEMEA